MNQGLLAPPRLLRVLVIDDDRDTVDSTAMLLGFWGHEVKSAYDGAGGLSMALGQPPDVILLDVAMPGMNGCEVLKRLRLRPGLDMTRIVAVSGYADAAHRSRCRQAGFDDFLAKPVNLSTLRSSLEFECERVRRGPRPMSSALDSGYVTKESRPRRETVLGRRFVTNLLDEKNPPPG
ncbi:MAG: response regulator [Gemmataceae bacterium]